MSCELFRLASARFPLRYPEQKDYCVTLIGKADRKVEAQEWTISWYDFQIPAELYMTIDCFVIVRQFEKIECVQTLPR